MKKFVALVALGTLGGFGGFVQHDINEAKARTVYVDRKVEVPVEVRKAPPLYISRQEFEELVYQHAASSGYDPRIFFVLGVVESSAGDRVLTNHERFEPGLYERFRKLWTKEDINEAERRRYATSYGIFQVVYGWHGTTCGLTSPDELKDPKTNLLCALKVWAAAWNRAIQETSNPEAQFYLAFLHYNGDGPSAHKYAEAAMRRYRQLIFADARKNMPQRVAVASQSKREA
jgi:hypothetical protein